MTAPVLIIPPEMRRRLWDHLLPSGSAREQAAFLFCMREGPDDGMIFNAIEADLLAPGDFTAQYEDYLELADAARIRLIKRAHALGACLAEFHSHPGPWPAAFSLSDRLGLRETIPHMRWRLNGRPYIAVVVAPGGFDALAWTRDPRVPDPLAGIRVGTALLEPTNASLEGWDDGI